MRMWTDFRTYFIERFRKTRCYTALKNFQIQNIQSMQGMTSSFLHQMLINCRCVMLKCMFETSSVTCNARVGDADTIGTVPVPWAGHFR